MWVCPECFLVYKGKTTRCGLDGAELVWVEEDPLPGRQIDRYIVEERLGAGGMSCVYAAHEEDGGRRVAIKILYGEMVVDKQISARFQREGRVACELRHPNIGSVYDSDTTDDGLSYLVMELLEGKTLKQVIDDEHPFPVERVAAITRQVALGLAHAHDQGFVHRDLKPSNIFLVGKKLETVKLLDFGIVGITQDSDSEDALTEITQTGMFVGTPTYMAPEQAKSPRVGPTADLYSLGVVLYQMLAGHPPFKGTFSEVLTAHTLKKPPPLPRSGFEKLAYNLLEKRPELRPTSGRLVAQMVADLEQANKPDDAPTLPTPPRPMSKPPTPIESSKQPSRTLALILLGLCSFAFFALILSQLDRKTPPVVALNSYQPAVDAHNPAVDAHNPVKTEAIDTSSASTETEEPQIAPEEPPPKKVKKKRRARPVTRKQKREPPRKLEKPAGSLKVHVGLWGWSGEIRSPIYIDGKQVGRSPLTITRPPGRYTIEARPNGYRARRRVVTLTNGEETVVKIGVCSFDQFGRLLVAAKDKSGKPLHGSIWVNGERRGTTPGSVKTPACLPLVVEVRADGYKLTKKTKVDPKETKRLLLVE